MMVMQLSAEKKGADEDELKEVFILLDADCDNFIGSPYKTIRKTYL